MTPAFSPTPVAPAKLKEPDGWLVVSRRRDTSRAIPPYRYFYGYDLETSRAGAELFADDLKTGEYGDLDFVAIIPCHNGLPVGPAERE